MQSSKSDNTCLNCQFATNRDVIQNPDLIRGEKNMPRCTNRKSKEFFSIAYQWKTCLEYIPIQKQVS